MPNKTSNDIVYVFIDYYQKGLWGGWLSKHSYWERAIPKNLPNIMHSNPVHICDITTKFMNLHGKKIQFVFSDSVKFLHQVESRTI